MENFTVYKHTSPNGKVYIGITGRDPTIRWANGKGYQGQPKFYKAILKYGWDNIKHEILFSGLSKDEACEKEIELIRKYDSVQCGYNSSTGGEHENSGAYKYQVGDVIGGFELVGRTERKLVVKCLDCGAVLERYSSCFLEGCIKCHCKIKHPKPLHKMNYRVITYKGETKRLTEWSEELGISKETLWTRYLKGYPIEEARKSPVVEKSCLICGSSFLPKYKSQIYCSPRCQKESRKKEYQLRTCIKCGKQFRPDRLLDEHYKGLYCSIECRLAGQKLRLKK